MGNLFSYQLIFIFLFLVIIVMLVFVRTGHDRERVREDLTRRGCTVLEITKGPERFPYGAMRSYIVKYRDENGAEHERHCVTNMFHGVYWRE